MNDLTLVADPDPEVWFAVPAEYPDPRGKDPRQWASAVAREVSASAAETEVLERLLDDLAQTEQGRDDGVAYLYLPRDGGPMQLARLRAVDTDDVADELPHGPLAPAQDVYDAELLGPARRSVLAGRAHEATADLLVTVVYRWTLDWMSVLLTLATLDPGQAVAMIGPLDEFADTVWVEDETGELVRADPVARPADDEAAGPSLS